MIRRPVLEFETSLEERDQQASPSTKEIRRQELRSTGTPSAYKGQGEHDRKKNFIEEERRTSSPTSVLELFRMPERGTTN